LDGLPPALGRRISKAQTQKDYSMKCSLIALATATLSLQALAAAPSSYTIVDLGADQQPRGVNDKGTIVGYTISSHSPVYYADGAWTALPFKGTSGEAVAINSHGVITGFDGQQVQWKNGQRHRLDGVKEGMPTGIADDGTIVGNYWGGSHFYCYKWKDGQETDIYGGDGGDCGVYAIDPNAAYIGGGSNAWIEDSTGEHDLGTLDSGQNAFSYTTALNKHGHAAVQSTYDGQSIKEGAAYWTGKLLVDIGLHDTGESFATAINEGDDVLVGGSDGQGHTLFLFSGRGKSSAPIEPLIANPAGWVFNYDVKSELAALGDDGSIYGTAYFNGQLHAFKLVPAGQ
jgi:hypothetical protein